ncbi:MAG: YggS family pyridoxal phosphate-dependent enzyme, partial [Polyangiaceae bacterium]|nr:YggS family pyridoxal phosphate-dependent enzyme [Polyangiaceae bacterium]
MTGIGERLALVRERIAASCARAGRDADEVTLVAVSKTHEASAIREAYAAGQRVFGENYVKELADKAEALDDLEGLELHFIGHLQRNKAKAVRRVARVVETVDSLRLAEALERAGGASPLSVFLQVNVAAEAQKSGCTPEALPELLEAVRALPSLRVRGLMTVPPADDDPEASRRWFRALRTLAKANGLHELSMGMS